MRRTVRLVAGAALAAPLAASPLWLAAQGSAVAPLSQVTISEQAAKRSMPTIDISVATAEQIVKACVDYAAARNGGASVVILSPSGYLVNAYRTDGQLPNNIDSAFEKAKTALYMRTSTHDVANRWSKAEDLIARANIGLYPLPGGLPIVVSGHLIGSIGVGGAPGDEQCAYEALTKVLGPQPPPAQTK